jgi:hypothetical protein
LAERGWEGFPNRRPTAAEMLATAGAAAVEYETASLFVS